MNCGKSLKIFRLFLILGISLLSNSVFSELYDLEYSNLQKEAEAQSQEGVFIKLRLKERPERYFPVFLYQIEKIENPHKIPKKVFEDSLFFLEKGNSFFSQGDYEKAIEFYKKASEINPSFISSFNNMGIAFFLLGKYKESRENFQKVLEINPFNPYPYFYLGWIYERLENFSLAERYLKQAEEICKRISYPYLLREIRDFLLKLELRNFKE